MAVVALCILVLSTLIYIGAAAGSDHQCMQNMSIFDCFCSSSNHPQPFKGSIDCGHDRNVSVIPLICVTTRNSSSLSIVAGSCPFTGNVVHTYLNGADPISTLDQQMCGKRNREGQLCGRCIADHSMTINTPELGCLNDTECIKPSAITWVIYFTEELVGITVFYLVMLVLNVRFTADGAAGSLLLAQLIVLPISIIDLRRDWMHVLPGNTYKYLTYILQLFYNVFNLNLHSGVFKPMCVADLSPSTLYALQYTASFYPLVLILISFIFIKLYEWDIKLVVWISRPLRLLWFRCRRKLDSRATVIDIFASFLILSYTKLTHTSFLLITPSNIYDSGDVVRGKVAVYDGTLPYFGHHHLPYAVFAILVLCFIVVPAPLLLLFYQFRWFQLCLSRIRINNHLLALFVHSFQRGYKDGNDNTSDLRFFSSLHFIIRIIIFGMYALIGDYFTLFYCLHLVAIVYAFVFGVFRPFKKDYYNKAESFMGLLMSFLTTTTIQNSIFLYFRKPSRTLASLIFVLALFPVLYMCCFIIVWIIKRMYARNKFKILRRLHNADSIEQHVIDGHHSIQDDQDPLYSNYGSTSVAGSVAGGGRRAVRHAIRNLMVNHTLTTPLTEDAPDRLSNPDDYSDLEFQWVPETDVGTNTTTDRSTPANTGSTYPNSTYSDQPMTNGSSSTASIMMHSGSKRTKSSRPTSLRSFKLHDLSEDKPTYPNTG